MYSFTNTIINIRKILLLLLIGIIIGITTMTSPFAIMYRCLAMIIINVAIIIGVHHPPIELFRHCHHCHMISLTRRNEMPNIKNNQ